MIYIDTHVAIYLHHGNLSLLTRKVKSLLEAETPILSGMAELELNYLYEVGKLHSKPATLISALQNEIGLRRCHYSCSAIAQQAKNLTWTRDPFDRMIVGNALLARKPLITKDRVILEHFADAVWS